MCVFDMGLSEDYFIFREPSNCNTIAGDDFICIIGHIVQQPWLILLFPFPVHVAWTRIHFLRSHFLTVLAFDFCVQDRTLDLQADGRKATINTPYAQSQ